VRINIKQIERRGREGMPEGSRKIEGERRGREGMPEGSREIQGERVCIRIYAYKNSPASAWKESRPGKGKERGRREGCESIDAREIIHFCIIRDDTNTSQTHKLKFKYNTHTHTQLYPSLPPSPPIT